MSANNSTNSTSVGDASGTGDVVFTSAPMTTTTNGRDSCTWYGGATCQQPRSCQDCLNVAISGDNCAIDRWGQCLSSYMTRDDDASYPAANFTYCSSNDATCSSCHDGWMDAFSAGSLDLTQRCVGTNGCICLSACEVPNRDAQIVQNTCSMYGSGANSAQIGLIVGMTVGAFLVFTLFVVLANLVVKRTAARREARQQAEREARREVRRPAASAHLPQLNLTGWTDMREKLVQNEHGQMEGAAKPTLSSTTAPAVIAEEDGEGYRPLSPSDRHSQRGD